MFPGRYFARRYFAGRYFATVSTTTSYGYFPARYFANRYFPGRYFPDGSSTATVVPEPEPATSYGYFPRRYFAGSYFPNRYFPGGEATGTVVVAGRASGHAYDRDNWTPRWTPIREYGTVELRIQAFGQGRVIGKSRWQLQREEEDELLLMGVL